MRTALARLLLGCFGAVLALATAEAALRLLPLPRPRLPAGVVPTPLPTWRDPAWGTPPDSAFRLRRSVDHEHAPDIDIVIPLAEHPGGSFHLRTNNLGLRRDDDTPVEKPPDVFRILVLGDSHTDGYVDNSESFSSLLEQQLNDTLADSGRRIEVLNGGVMGYSPAQEFFWYHGRGVELKPDLVLVVFYVGNDVGELLFQISPRVDPSTGRAVAPIDDSPTEPGGPLGDLRLGLLARYTVQAGPLPELWQRANRQPPRPVGSERSRRSRPKLLLRGHHPAA